MSAHTPGPWKVEAVFIAQHTCDPLHFGEYRFPFQRTVDGSSRTYSREEAEANARLIASAPELLSALKALLGLIEGECPSLLEDDHHYEIVSSAIAKAEGRS